MKKYLPLVLALVFGTSLFSQELRNSLMQYQFNALPLNPAYAGRIETVGFDAVYFGNFVSEFQLSRTALVSVFGRPSGTENVGLGGTLQFYQQDFFGEINLQPAYSRQFALGEGAMAIGATLGVNYFAIDHSVLSSISSNFMSIDGGLGLYYYSGQSFVGLSALRIFEKPIFLEEDIPGNSLQRENPFSLHAGAMFRLNDQIKIKPVALLGYSRIYSLSEFQKGSASKLLTADMLANLVVDDTYVVGLLLGYSDVETGRDYSRVGISATLLLGSFRLSYGIQHNNQPDRAVSLPFTHLIGAGYDFPMGGDEAPFRYF